MQKNLEEYRNKKRQKFCKKRKEEYKKAKEEKRKSRQKRKHGNTSTRKGKRKHVYQTNYSRKIGTALYNATTRKR